MSVPFDVVIVPDFSGRARVTFEARTLYFLASWIEFADARDGIPLHLACIGEPPASVCELADRCGAIISRHLPASGVLGVYANKLRGFEAPLRSDRILLLDVDILVLSKLGDLARAAPFDAISAAHSHSAIMLPEMWDALYAALKVEPPRERIRDFHLTLDTPTASLSLYPSYNTGVILAPRRSELHRLWLEHLGVLGSFREAWDKRLKPLNMAVTDEPAFASAVHVLKERGVAFAQLPDRYNGRWRHLYRRSPPMREFAVFHMTSSFADGTNLLEKVSPSAWHYQKKLFRRYGKRWLTHSESYSRDALRYLLPASLELLQLGPILQRLYSKHIRTVVS